MNKFTPKGIIFDMDGVLRIGSHPVKHANEIIQLLKNKKIPGMISTNECRYSETELRDDLEELGITIPNDWIIYTSAMAIRDYLEKKIKKNKEKNFSIGIIGEKGLFQTVNEITNLKNCEICEIPPKYKTKKILIIGSVNKIKISTLEKGLKWIQSGAKVLTTCNDVSDPASKGDFNLGMPNHILHLLKYNTIGIKSYSLGKPHPIHAQKIFSNFKDINPKDLLFVGDTIYTDIQLAEENNIKNCLVLTGSSSRDTTKSYIIEPDYILESIKDLEIFLS